MKTALTIAGTDPSGGAGIQADIKTMTANGVFATCAVTALVAQNTTGVKSIVECTPDFLAEELDCVFTDIFPDAVKTGMVSSIPLIRVIAAKLKEYGAKNLVVDPVMVATSGDRLITEDAVSALKELLLPLATVLTPNIPEAEILSGMTIRSAADMEAAARGTASRRSSCPAAGAPPPGPPGPGSPGSRPPAGCCPGPRSSGTGLWGSRAAGAPDCDFPSPRRGQCAVLHRPPADGPRCCDGLPAGPSPRQNPPKTGAGGRR